MLLFGGEAANGAKSDVWELVDTAAATDDPAPVETEVATAEPVEDSSDL